jgi:hypothetical protein
MRNPAVILSFLLVSVQGIMCQEKSDTLSSAGTVSLSLKNINFFEDNEYYNPVIEGYTLLGFFIQPAVIYAPSKKVTLQLGVHLLNYSGADKISVAKLVFSTTYNFAPGTFLTFGTLNGSDNHRMLDPHFNKERLYNKYAEEGLQFVTDNPHFFNDLWLSWEHFISKGDNNTGRIIQIYILINR